MGYNTTHQYSLDIAGLVVFNRIPNISNDKFFHHRKRLGFRYVLDLDDYWHIGEQHPLHRSYRDNNYGIKSEELIREADYVTVTTSLLADEVLRLNKKVMVIPNSLPFDNGQFSAGNRQISRDVKFIYAGGSSHYSDIKLIEGILDSYNVRLAGHNKNHSESVKISKLLPNSELFDNLNLDKYMKCYNGCDVSIAPLENNKFNTLKSNLKILEAGCKAIPIICSKIKPYFNEVDDKYVDYASSRAEWEDKVKYFSKNPMYGIERGLALAEYVRKHYNMKDTNETRKQLYAEMLK